MFTSLKNKLFGGAAKSQPEQSAHVAAAAPTEAEANASEFKKRGNALREQGQLQEAVQCYRQARALAPNDVGALVNLGFVLSELELYAEARSHLDKAIQLDPKQDDALYILGTIERATGNPDKAIERFASTLALKPDFSLCRLELCRLLFERGRADEAKQLVRAGIAIDPNSADLHYYLGNLHHEARELDEAVSCFQKALALQPDYVEVHNNLGNTLLAHGKLEASIESYRKVIALDPTYPNAHSTMLFPLNYHPDLGADEIFAAYRAYDAHVGLPLRSAWRAHDNDRNVTRRLRVGYVSADFYEHAVRSFLEPLLANHDRAAVEIFAYAELDKEDSTTAIYRRHVDHWTPTMDLSDDALAERVRFDKIDILVDLAGHTAKNRLGVFARKPAPVSLSWLGYGYTTGLGAIDYFLTDSISAPSGSESLFAEKPWRLSTPACTYRPAVQMGAVSNLPAHTNDVITFGTLTRAIRINRRSIRVWAELLKRVSGSRLVVNSTSFREPAMRTRLAEQFAASGIESGRLQIGYDTPPWDVLRGMDIALDCFPHNSGTTLFESLYMGVPFVTLAGRPSVGRLGSSVLLGAGHPEWIAHSEDEYIDKAVALASDLPKLAALRAGLRAQIEASPIRDEAGFARKVEAAYREMFAIWADGANDDATRTTVLGDGPAISSRASGIRPEQR
jgi:protein O-GlcNAc transferase